MEIWYVITMPLEMETLWELIANSVVMQATDLQARLLDSACPLRYGPDCQHIANVSIRVPTKKFSSVQMLPEDPESKFVNIPKGQTKSK